MFLVISNVHELQNSNKTDQKKNNICEREKEKKSNIIMLKKLHKRQKQKKKFQSLKD